MKNSQEDTPNHQNAVSHQFHQHAASLPGRLTPCVVRLVGCHENPALQEARCAVPRNIHALPGSGRSATASHETTARGLPCPGGHKDNRSSGSARYTVSLQNNYNIRLVAVLRAACKSRQKRKSTARLCRLTAGQSAKHQNNPRSVHDLRKNLIA